MNAHKLELQLGALLKRFNFEYIYANDFLRIVKPTSENLNKYEHYINSATPGRVFLVFVTLVPKIVFESFRAVVSSILKHKESNLDNLTKQESSNSLFVSHYTGIPMAPRIDPYYGVIPAFLQDKGHRISILYLNHTHTKSKIIKEQFGSMGLKSINAIPHSLPPVKQVQIVLQLFFQSLQIALKAILTKEFSIEQRLLLLGASSYQMHRSTLSNIVFMVYFRERLRSERPESVIITFEGHAFEVLASRIITRDFPNIELFLYQHAPVLPDQFGVLRTLSELEPSVKILTTGETTRLFFMDHLRGKANLVTILGTPKFQNAIEGKKLAGNSSKLKKTCLVAPEGTVAANTELLELTLKVARLVPSFKFIFRMHPALRLTLEHSHLLEIEPPTNFIVSQMSLELDLATSDFCIYRSSAVSIEGLLFSVRPIHFNSHPEVCLDPIEHRTMEHKQFSHFQPLADYLTDSNKPVFSDFEPTEDEMRETYFNYFSPFNLNTLESRF